MLYNTREHDGIVRASYISLGPTATMNRFPFTSHFLPYQSDKPPPSSPTSNSAQRWLMPDALLGDPTITLN